MAQSRLAIAIPRSMVERKPKHGEPCTHCGVCCAGSLCALGQRVFDRPAVPGPCPALVLDTSGKSLCTIVMNARAFNLASPESDAELTRSALMLIGSGYGCDARINGEPSNPAFNAYLEDWDRRHARDIERARHIWGMAPSPTTGETNGEK